MKLAINALHLIYGQRDGVETELVELIRHAAPQLGNDELYLLANHELFQRISTPSGVKIIDCPVTGKRVINRVVFEQRHLNRICAKNGIDVALFMGAVMPLNLKIPAVLLINDMQPWVYPQYFAWHKRQYLYYFVPRSAHKAQAIITTSQYSKQDIVRLLNVPGGKIHVTALSGSSYRRVEDQSLRHAAQRKYGLPKHYLMCLASSYPHKNLQALVRAYHCFVQKYPDTDIDLALLGTYSQNHTKIQVLVGKLRLEHRVHQPGRIDDKELAALYSGAEVFVFPSRFEGFGMPVLEAMACGTPVASSDATALPEVYGNAALAFDPNDISQITQAIERLVFDKELRAEMISRGYEQVKKFSWKNTASKILKILRSVAD